MTNAYGYAQVYIDGVFQGAVDQYAAQQAWRSRVWQSGVLARGTHTIEIMPTGTKRAVSTAANVVIDAIDVTP